MRRALPLLIAAACASEPGSPEWLVNGPRFLAIVAEPPEVPPGQSATFRALYVDQNGPRDASQVQWQPCTSPLPLDETGAVSTACISDSSSAATGSAATVGLASDGCSRFGPVPSPDSQRAREPDATGGYYQPVRAELGGEVAFAGERLRCPLVEASFQLSQQYERTYPLNRNPVIESLAASQPLAQIPAGAQVSLTLSWTAASVEVFPVFDPASLSLVSQQETMSVSWFTTGGTLRDARTGSGANVWTAPAAPATVYLWAVLRDSRGGTAFAGVTAQVQ